MPRGVDTPSAPAVSLVIGYFRDFDIPRLHQEGSTRLAAASLQVPGGPNPDQPAQNSGCSIFLVWEQRLIKGDKRTQGPACPTWSWGTVP